MNWRHSAFPESLGKPCGLSPEEGRLTPFLHRLPPTECRHQTRSVPPAPDRRPARSTWQIEVLFDTGLSIWLLAKFNKRQERRRLLSQIMASTNFGLCPLGSGTPLPCFRDLCKKFSLALTLWRDPISSCLLG